jgi:transcriptional regulator with XRE-family HTH domain
MTDRRPIPIAASRHGTARNRPIAVPFGDLLRQCRVAAGLTQEELAARSMVSVRTISDLERGLRHRPQRETLRLLTDALDLRDDFTRQVSRCAARSATGSVSHRYSTISAGWCAFRAITSARRCTIGKARHWIERWGASRGWRMPCASELACRSCPLIAPPSINRSPALAPRSEMAPGPQRTTPDM